MLNNHELGPVLDDLEICACVWKDLCLEGSVLQVDLSTDLCLDGSRLTVLQLLMTNQKGAYTPLQVVQLLEVADDTSRGSLHTAPSSSTLGSFCR